MGNASGRMWFVVGVLAAAAMAAYLALVPLTRSLGPDASIPGAVTIASSDRQVNLTPTDFSDAGGSSTFVRAIPKKAAKPAATVATQRTGEPRSATALVNAGGATSSGGGATSSGGSAPPAAPPARKPSAAIGSSGETVGAGGLASSGGSNNTLPDDGPTEVGSSGELAP